MREVPCPECDGARLNPLSLAVTVDGRNIFELCSLSIGEAAAVIAGLELSERDQLIAEQVLKEINARWASCSTSGSTTSPSAARAGTLSGARGPADPPRQPDRQRSRRRPVRARRAVDRAAPARQRQAASTPSERLRDLGNTVLVVEHDEETIRVADHVVDIGPGAGEHGGEIVHSGTVNGLLKSRKIADRPVPVGQEARSPRPSSGASPVTTGWSCAAPGSTT